MRVLRLEKNHKFLIFKIWPQIFTNQG